MSTYVGANLAWQLGGDQSLIHELAKDADCLVLVEARDIHNRPVNVKAILGNEWWVGQNLRSASTAGSVIAIRKKSSVKRRRMASLLRLVQISGSGRKLQARYLRSLPIRDEDGDATLFAAHNPLVSTGQQVAATRVISHTFRSTSGRKLLFADCNAKPSGFAADIGANHFSGDGVMVWAWSKGWTNTGAHWRSFRGSDHKVGILRTG